MPSETKPTKANSAGVPPPEPEHLPCPRCNSVNTKFCYYNNYNFSQPRHFCKSCRRYWTHGGTLRDIPVGGGTRKRSRIVSVASPNANQQTVVYGEAKPGFNYGSFTSLLGSNGQGFSGFGPVGGQGFMSPVWPFQGGMIGDTWNMQGGESGFLNGGNGGECFSLPELAISTTGNYSK